MSENLEEIKQIDRLIEYFATKGIEGYQKIEKIVGLGAGFITKSKQRDGQLSGSVLAKVVKNCQDLNITWLITGRPPMKHDPEFFKQFDDSVEDHRINEADHNISTNWKEKYYKLNEKYAELQEKYILLLDEVRNKRNTG